MSAALTRALAAGSLVVRKVASGEVIVLFNNPVSKKDKDGKRYSVNINPVKLSHGNAVNLFDRVEVDKQAIEQSNLRKLLAKGVIEVV